MGTNMHMIWNGNNPIQVHIQQQNLIPQIRTPQVPLTRIQVCGDEFPTMQYPGSGPGWRMQRPPRGGFGPPRGEGFGQRFGPPRGGFGPQPPPWAFRGRGGWPRGGPPMRFRGAPPPHWFAQQEFLAQAPQEVFSTDPTIQHNPAGDEATRAQGDPQVRRRESQKRLPLA